MQCAHCATPVPADAKFCHNCGSQVSDAEGQAAATAAIDASALLHIETLLREDTKGEFEVERLLGRGGMALVYLATEVHLGRKVAIKVLPPELTFGHGVERFKREAKTAAALDHPNIIPVYRVASGGKIFWYAMKYLVGRSLEELLKEKQRLGLKDTVDILAQVADALDYAHQHRVIHRDVKPANVMLDAQDRVIVTDFGIAKALTEGTLTASGSVVGTPYYMAPEQGLGHAVSGASDQYSVAVMAYRMLSGQVPFEGDSAIDILHKHCMTVPPPLDVLQTGLPAHTYLAVHKGLAKKPEHRFSTVKALVDALRQPTPDVAATEAATLLVAQSAPAPATPAAPGISRAAPAPPERVRPAAPARPAPPPSRPRGRRVPTLALGATVVLVLAGVVWGVMGGGRGERPAGRQARDTGTGPPAVPPTAEGPAVPTSVGAEREAPGERTTGAAPAPQPAPSTSGRVAVTGLPTGGTVAADGRPQRGTRFELGSGRHTIRMEARGYEPQTEVVTVTPGGEVRVIFRARRVPSPAQPPPGTPAPTPAQVAPTGGLSTLRISISPAANVFVDEVDRGQNTRVQEGLLPGTHTLRFVRDGYVTKDTTVTLSAGATVTIRVELLPRNR